MKEEPEPEQRSPQDILLQAMEEFSQGSQVRTPEGLKALADAALACSGLQSLGAAVEALRS